MAWLYPYLKKGACNYLLFKVSQRWHPAGIVLLYGGNFVTVPGAYIVVCFKAANTCLVWLRFTFLLAFGLVWCRRGLAAQDIVGYVHHLSFPRL